MLLSRNLEEDVKNRAMLLSIFIILVIIFSFTACPLNDPMPAKIPFEGNPSGTGTGSAWGYHDWINVQITMVEGFITEAIVTGDDSPGVGAVAIQFAGDTIVKNNSVEIDVVASATITTTAIREAGRQAIDEILAANP